MAFEDGPFLQAACFCEMAIRDDTGVFSLIRIIDTINVEQRGPEPPDEMPPITTNLKLVLMFKSGKARGRSDVTIQPELPSGLRQDTVGMTIHFEGDEKGHTFVSDMQYTFTQEGLHWFRISVDEHFMTAVPIRIKYSRFSVR